MQWKIIHKENAYRGFFSIDRYQLQHELFAGGTSAELGRELLERGHAVAVVMYDPLLDKVILIEQFRIGAIHDPDGPWLLEFVAGVIEEGEREQDVLIRECREEAGVEVQHIEPIYRYYSSPGGCSEQISLYYAEVDSRTADGVHGVEHEGEDIMVQVVSYSQALALLQQGRINSATPVIAMQWLQLNRDRLQRECRQSSR